MLESQLRKQINSLIKREVVPATGCTEPIAVALCAATAARMMSSRPIRTDVRLSANILKNALGVGIPGTGMTGLPIAIALGTLYGDPSRELDLLGGITPRQVEIASATLGSISIGLAPETCDILHIDVTHTDALGNESQAIITGQHTNVAYRRMNKTVFHDTLSNAAENSRESAEPHLTMKTVWRYAMETPLEELRFILETRKVNKLIAERSFTGKYGHSVGRILHSARQRSVMGDSIFSRILSYTSAAADARMAGAPMPVMSNSGSGNQGIAATLPVVIYAEDTFAGEAQTIRALILSHLTVIYIKQSLGRLSALCGCVVAATGSACGIAYLMGGNYDTICATVKNMVANLTGMICDGAKPSCAMKLASGVSTALMSAMMAMEGECVSSLEGIIDDDIDKTVANLTSIGRDGMRETDRMILDIMTSKSHSPRPGRRD